MAMFRVGVEVEVLQDGQEEPGLRGCWFTATIIHVAKGTYTVEYHEILTLTGERDTDKVPLSRLRPIYQVDDSRSVPLEKRSCGEPVDCWYRDGWWEGYVHITRDTEVVATFPEGTGDEVSVSLDPSHVEEDEQEPRRLRTRRKWLYKEKMWTPVAWKTWPGARNERAAINADASANTARRAAAADRTDGQAHDRTAGDAAASRTTAGHAAAADRTDGHVLERASGTAPVPETARSQPAARDRKGGQASERAAGDATVAERGTVRAAASDRTDGQANQGAAGDAAAARKGTSRAAAPDRALRQSTTPQVAGAGAAAGAPDRSASAAAPLVRAASQAAPLGRAASRAEVLQRAAHAAAMPEAGPSHAAVPIPQLASKVSKDIFEQKQRELDQQRAKNKALKLPAFDSASDDSDDGAKPEGRAKKGSEKNAHESAEQKDKSNAGKSGIKLKLPASKVAGQKLDKSGELEVKAATWTGDKEAPSSSAAGQADPDTDPLGKATVLGGPPSESAQKDAEAHKGASAAPQQKQARTQKDASKGASAAPHRDQSKAQNDAETAKGKAGTAAKKGAAVVPQGLKKKGSAGKKELVGAKSKAGAVRITPEEEQALKIIKEEGWEPITNVDKDKPWTAEEVDMMFTVEGKVEDMLVRRHVILKLLPCRDPDSHRKARSAHRPKLDEIRAAAFSSAAAAGPAGKPAPHQRPVQRQQSLQQTKSQHLQQQLQQQLHVKTAPPSSRPGPDAVAAADSPREQVAALLKGTGAKGDDASLPSSPTGAADTPTAAQACRGKPRVTEIFGKSSLLAPTLAKLQHNPTRLSSQGLGGMPDWDRPASSAAAPPATGKGQSASAKHRGEAAAAQQDAAAAATRKTAPESLKTEQAPQQWVPMDPRIRFNRKSSTAEAMPESNMPKAERAQMKLDQSHPEPSTNGDVHMFDAFAEPLPSTEPEAKVDTSKPRRRSRSPEDRDLAPEKLPDFPPIKRPRTRLGAKAESGSPSHIICLDGIGAVFKSNKELEVALRPFVPDFTKVELAREVVEGMLCLGGWAAVFFPSPQDAEEHLTTMQNLYLKTSASPLPRPLLAHYPRKSSEDFWKHVNYGFPKGIFVAPHFAQPNSIEFEPALRWRQLQRSLADAKRAQRETHAADLAEVMRAYQKVKGVEGASADHAPPPPPNKSSWLFVKGIGGPALADVHVIRSAFDQWGAREIRVLKDPATHELRGIALVRLNQQRQVEMLKGDLDEMVYIMAGSPRPVEAHMLDTGLPRECWQAVYDSALFRAFKRDDRGNGPAEPPGTPPPRLLKINHDHPRSMEEWYGLRLRVLAERGAEERLQQQDLADGQRHALHVRHTRQIDQEMAKLLDANTMNCKPFMQKLRKNNRPVKPLRFLPERYKYLLQNGAVRMARPPNGLAAGRPASGNRAAAGIGQNPAQRVLAALPGAAGQGRANPARTVRHMPVGRGMTMGATRDTAKAIPRRQNAGQGKSARGNRRGAR